MNVAVLAHDGFPGEAKTAIGILRYGDQTVSTVLDREHAGDTVGDHVPDLAGTPAGEVPIVANVESIESVPGSESEQDGAIDALVIGVAPVGGAFEAEWRPDVSAALERGWDVHAGLHDFLADDPSFARLAKQHDATIEDVRRPPSDLDVASGTAGDVDATVVATVGTDCSTGKMTTSFALRDAARAEGIDAAVVPTGQTGILIADRGIAIDRTIADYAAGAVERLIHEAAEGHDLLVVEGQGALAHPAYSGVTTSILHGAMPDGLVLCHEADRERVQQFEAFEMPPPEEYARLYQSMAAPVSGADVVAGALNTSHLAPDAASDAVTAFGDAIDAPTADPVREGVPPAVLNAVLGAGEPE